MKRPDIEAIRQSPRQWCDIPTVEKLSDYAMLLEAENAALKEQVAQLAYDKEQIDIHRKQLAAYIQGLPVNARETITTLQSKSAALVDALEKSRIGLVQWHVPENRYSAINAIDDALAAFKGEK